MNADRRAMAEKSGTFRAHHANEGRSISGPRAIFRFVMRFSGSGDATRTRDSLLGKYRRLCAVANWLIFA
jgi:hypothetical protein